tara:strand:+ start:199 stop:600 length:402 start_codon:yes stop_codon:yes gene_type:complete
MTTSACEAFDESKEYVSGPQSLNVDLNALTFGKIDWERVHGSLCWLAKKVQEVCEAEGKDKMQDYENGQSQFLAKTCVMHVVHTFHTCRYDAPHGEPGDADSMDDVERALAPASAPVEESIPSPPPSATESRS